MRKLGRKLLIQVFGGRSFEAMNDARMRRVDLLTVDVFDTLVTRLVYHPADVFKLADVVLRREGIIRADLPPWSEVRSRAEDEVRKASIHEEVRLSEIYDWLLNSGHVPSGKIDAAMGVELMLERALSRPITSMVNCVNQVISTGGAVVAVSDTYFSASEVRGLLDQAGVDKARTGLVTSADKRLTKRTGTLFRSMLPEWLRAGRNRLHVGDNFESDFLRARLAGMQAAPFLSGKPSLREKALHKSLEGQPLLQSVVAGSARATRLGGTFADKHAQAVWDISATMTGPLLFTFVAWSLSEAVRKGVRRLYFFARDGEILMKIAAELQPILAPGVECRYLYVSRKSLHLPAVTEFGEAQNEWIFDGALGSSLRTFLARLDLTPEAYLALLGSDSPVARHDPDLPLTEELVEEIKRSTEQASVRQLILDRATTRRRDCLAYLTQEGMLDGGPIGVVDIGWRGRLQRSISIIVSTQDPAVSDRLSGYYIDLDVVPTDAGTFTRFAGLCPEETFSWAGRASIFEVLCSAHHGTTVGYERDSAGVMQPILASPRNAEAEAWGVDLQQAAATEFARNVITVLSLAGINALDHLPALARTSLQVAKTVILSPSRAEAEALGTFRHASDERHTVMEEIAGVIDFRPQAIRQRFGPAYRGRRISYWPEASVVRSTPNAMRPLALSMLRRAPGRAK
jgi:FMN phosphatase YigB (HAD superfamily)